jgi:hypothetical protein
LGWHGEGQNERRPASTESLFMFVSVLRLIVWLLTVSLPLREAQPKTIMPFAGLMAHLASPALSMNNLVEWENL